MKKKIDIKKWMAQVGYFNHKRYNEKGQLMILTGYKDGNLIYKNFAVATDNPQKPLMVIGN